jgi:hypothetical protein
MLYQQKYTEAFQQFAVLLNELTTITEQIFVLKGQGIIENFDEQKYLAILTEAMSALETRDDVLLADILNYELTEQLEELNTQL